MELFQPLLPRAEKSDEPTYTPSGFQSPAKNYRQKALSLDDLLITCPAATFYVRVDESPLKGIEPDDLLVVNRAKKPQSGSIAVVILDGEYALRRLMKRENTWTMQSDEVASKEQLVDETVICWGVVHAVVRILTP